jgi:hypothetical protein
VVDWLKATIEYLQQTEINTLVEGRIYAGVEMPTYYVPATGPAILFAGRGGGFDGSRVRLSTVGGGVGLSNAVLTMSVMFRVYGQDVESIVDTDRKLFDVFQEATYCKIKMAWLDIPGQIAKDSNGWDIVMSLWNVSYTN